MAKYKYSYPAIFTPEENGRFSVDFPDFEGCYTCGDDLTDAIMMAEDVLAFTIYDYEKEGKTVPTPAQLDVMAKNLPDHSFINVIACDTLWYRKKHSAKAVKKTLTIPSWLNEEATNMGLNFSQVLQDALTQIVCKE